MAGSIGGIGVGIGSASSAASSYTSFASSEESESAAASANSANANVATGFDASSFDASSFTESAMEMRTASAVGGNEPFGGGWNLKRQDDQLPPMQPCDDMLAQVAAAYSANQLA